MKTIDQIIDELAARQHGVVSRRQLLDAGCSAEHIRRRVRSGRLRRVARGVYRVGPVSGPLVREWELVLGGTKGAALADWGAARVLGLATSQSPGTQGLLLVPPTASGRRSGVRRTGSLLPEEVTRVDGLPVTTAARTLLDLAQHGETRALEDAFGVALRTRLTTDMELRAIIARHPGHRGARVLAALLGDTDLHAAPTRSEAERRLLRLFADGGLPAPAVNVNVHGFELDMYWKRHRVAVEMDGAAFHSSNAAFHRDRRRDAVLAAADILVTRVTWRHLKLEPKKTLVRVAQALVLRDPDVARCRCGAVTA